MASIFLIFLASEIATTSELFKHLLHSTLAAPFSLRCDSNVTQMVTEKEPLCVDMKRHKICVCSYGNISKLSRAVIGEDPAVFRKKMILL